MPDKYQHVYNGNTVVLRKVKKASKASAPGPALVLEPTVILPKPIDKKAMQAKLAAELFKTL